MPNWWARSQLSIFYLETPCIVFPSLSPYSAPTLFSFSQSFLLFSILSTIFLFPSCLLLRSFWYSGVWFSTRYSRIQFKTVHCYSLVYCRLWYSVHPGNLYILVFYTFWNPVRSGSNPNLLLNCYGFFSNSSSYHYLHKVIAVFFLDSRRYYQFCIKCRTSKTAPRPVSIQVQPVNKQCQQGHKLFSDQFQTNGRNLSYQYQQGHEFLRDQCQTNGHDLSNQYQQGHNLLRDQCQTKEHDLSYQCQRGHKLLAINTQPRGTITTLSTRTKLLLSM